MLRGAESTFRPRVTWTIRETFQQWQQTGLLGDVRAAIILVCAVRLVCTALQLTAPVLPTCGWEDHPQPHTSGLTFQFLGVWNRHDTCWYEFIADRGYRPGNVSIAYYPLYPLLVRLINYLARDLTLSGLIVSSLAYVAALVGLYRLLRRDFDEQVVQRTVLYMAIFPSAFFFMAPYTETLFLALCVWTLHCARSSRWGCAGILALLAALTRNQGVTLSIVLAWEVVRQWRAGRCSRSAAIVPVLPPVVVLLFFLYGKVAIGVTPLEAQRFWNLRTVPPWTAVATSWSYVSTSHDPVEILNLLCLGFAAVLLVIGLWKLPLVYTLYAAPQLLIIASRQNAPIPLNSTSRYVLVLFPLFIVLALLLRRRPARYLWLGFSTLLLGVLFGAFLKGWFLA